MTPEGKVKEKVKRILKAHGVWYTMPRGTAVGSAGIPDLLCLCKGMFFAIETKAGNNKPTALQTMTLRAIEEHGGRSFVINETNIDQLEEFLDSIV